MSVLGTAFAQVLLSDARLFTNAQGTDNHGTERMGRGFSFTRPDGYNVSVIEARNADRIFDQVEVIVWDKDGDEVLSRLFGSDGGFNDLFDALCYEVPSYDEG